MLGPVSNRVRGIILLHASPPEPSHNRNKLFNKSFRENNGKHIIDGNRRKNQLNIRETAHMVDFISFNSGSLARNLL
jgi:hypothetical protein